MSFQPRAIAIVHSGHIGDVIACFPMAALLRKRFPAARTLFIARRYTQAAVEACADIDEYLDEADVREQPLRLKERRVDVLLNPHHEEPIGELAKAAGVPIRIGNLRRLRTLRWANRFMYSGAKNLPVHAANLNLRHLRPLGIRVQYSLSELTALVNLTRRAPLSAIHREHLAGNRFNLILHPKSKGNAREWPSDHFDRLACLLPPDRFRIFLTGSMAEREQLRRECPALWQHPHVVDLMGQFNLEALISFIGEADGLVAASTGPLHIAAATGIPTLGLFPGRASMNTTRWHPIGRRAETLCVSDRCQPVPGSCPKAYAGESCACMIDIRPIAVMERVLAWEQGNAEARTLTIRPPNTSSAPPQSGTVSGPA